MVLFPFNVQILFFFFLKSVLYFDGLIFILFFYDPFLFCKSAMNFFARKIGSYSYKVLEIKWL